MKDRGTEECLVGFNFRPFLYFSLNSSRLVSRLVLHCKFLSPCGLLTPTLRKPQPSLRSAWKMDMELPVLLRRGWGGGQLVKGAVAFRLVKGVKQRAKEVFYFPRCGGA